MAKIKLQSEGLNLGTAPITTDGIVSTSFTVDGFNPNKGYLVRASLNMTGVMISTALISDVFGFGGVSTAYANWAGFFSAGKGTPKIMPNALELVASGTGFVAPFGTDSIILNSTSAEIAYFEDAGDFTSGKDLKINYDFGGSFLAFPFGTLPQQGVQVSGVMVYEYVNESAVRRGNGNDNTMKGTATTDVFLGRGGNDKLTGGKGDDFFDGGGGKDKLDGGAGADSLVGGAGADKLYGGKGNDILRGNDGDDLIKAGSGADTLFGQSGRDKMMGGDGVDNVYGGSKKDRIYGDGGGDTLSGEAGDDVLFGGKGNDYIFGGDGADRIEGGKGVDYLVGGKGADRFVLNKQDPDGAYIRDFGRGNDVIDLTQFDVRRKNVDIRFDDDFDDVVVTVRGTIETVVEDITLGDINFDMILL